jgi:hypothetical protein
VPNEPANSQKSSKGVLMGGNADGLQSLAKYTKMPVARIRYVPDAGIETVRSIHCGILYLMAFWSGYSVQAFAKLAEIVSKFSDNELEFVVVDVDGSPDLYEMSEFKGRIHGYGETAWVMDGGIVATSGRGLNTACFEANTLALVAQAKGM